MSLRRNRKQSPVKKAAKLWAGSKVAKTAARAGRKPAAIAGAVLGLVGLVAAARKRRTKQADLPYGPPNESVPSHETLAPAKDEASKVA